jgi:hypothetical protein
VNDLFFDAKSSAKLLQEEEDKYLKWKADSVFIYIKVL